MDSLVDCLNRVVERAAQAWVEEFERQHSPLIALLEGVETEDEALASLVGLSLEELLSL